jgi:hypothetical protein
MSLNRIVKILYDLFEIFYESIGVFDNLFRISGFYRDSIRFIREISVIQYDLYDYLYQGNTLYWCARYSTRRYKDSHVYLGNFKIYSGYQGCMRYTR